MDKIKLEFKAPKNKTIEYNGVEIQIIPYLDFIQQVGLVNKYVNDYFGEIENKLVPQSPYNFIEAEYNLKVYVIQTLTNIDVESLSVEIMSDENLFSNIVHNVSNYDEFRYRLDMVVDEIKEEIKLKRSLGQVIDNALEKFSGILEMMNNLSPEDIRGLQEETKTMLAELEKSAVVSETLGIKKGKK